MTLDLSCTETDTDPITGPVLQSVDYGLIINGEEVDASYRERFDADDPATGRAFATVALGREVDVNRAVAAARKAFTGEWSRISATERGRLLQRAAARLLQIEEPLARLEARDCGKPLDQARADVRTAARYLELFGNSASALHGSQIPVAPDVLDFTIREPFGISAQINSWNFPINMAARSLGAALAAGNTVVIKTPELAATSTTVLGRVLHDVGLPGGVVNIVHGYGADVGAALSSHPDVDLITFTGSVPTGRSVAANAARNLIPCVLELGGKSPVVIFDDADIERAARQLATGFTEANGQSCDLPSLVLVQESRKDEFIRELADHVDRLRIGPGLENPDVSALISRQQRDRVAAFVDHARLAGATVVRGGCVPSGPEIEDGWFYEPTILSDVQPHMAVAREEIFGPVVSVMTFEDEAEAVTMANASAYGLSSYVWTRDTGRALRMSLAIRAGQVYVNCYSSGDSPMLPFGGFKKSGYGREKGVEALKTYTQTKNICLSLA